MKLRLLNICLPHHMSFTDMVHPLRVHSYKPGGESRKGFEISYSSECLLKSRFIVRRVVDEVIESPYAEEEVITSTYIETYDTIAWPLGNGNICLVLKNSPRGVRPLIDMYSLLYGYGFSIEPIKLDVASFVDVFSGIKEVKEFTIKKIKSTNILVNKDSTASVEITSSVNALNDLDSFLGSRNRVLTKLRYEAKLINGVYKGEVLSSGGLYLDDLFIEHLGIDFPDLINMVINNQ